jgi:sulfur transfer protein SufE
MNYSEIKSLLNSTDNPVQKLEFLMDLGDSLPKIPDGKHGTEIRGCASRVEIFKDKNNNIYGFADSKLVSGIVTILIEMKKANVNLDDFWKLSLNLGSSRVNGATSMIAFLKAL